MIKRLISFFKFIWINLLKLNNLLASPQRVTSIKTIIRRIKALIIFHFVNGAYLVTICDMIIVSSKFYSVLCEYNISKHQLKLLHVKHKFLFNTLYSKKLCKIKPRISKKNIFLLVTWQKI